MPKKEIDDHENNIANVKQCNFEVMMQNADRLDSEIIYDRDFDYDYFGFKVSSCSSIAAVQLSLIPLSRLKNKELVPW